MNKDKLLATYRAVFGESIGDDLTERVNLIKEYAEPESVLTVDDYKNAIDACSACNVSGLIRSLNDMIERIWNCDKKYGIGTYFVNHHPIIQLYAYQIAYLSHGREPIEWAGFSDAYKFCKSVVAGDILPDSNWMVAINTCYHR
jgi:hypothetical protein